MVPKTMRFIFKRQEMQQNGGDCEKRIVLIIYSVKSHIIRQCWWRFVMSALTHQCSVYR